MREPSSVDPMECRGRPRKDRSGVLATRQGARSPFSLSTYVRLWYDYLSSIRSNRFPPDSNTHVQSLEFASSTAQHGVKLFDSNLLDLAELQRLNSKVVL